MREYTQDTMALEEDELQTPQIPFGDSCIMFKLCVERAKDLLRVNRRFLLKNVVRLGGATEELKKL